MSIHYIEYLHFTKLEKNTNIHKSSLAYKKASL